MPNIKIGVNYELPHSCTNFNKINMKIRVRSSGWIVLERRYIKVNFFRTLLSLTRFTDVTEFVTERVTSENEKVCVSIWDWLFSNILFRFIDTPPPPNSHLTFTWWGSLRAARHNKDSPNILFRAEH